MKEGIDITTLPGGWDYKKSFANINNEVKGKKEEQLKIENQEYIKKFLNCTFEDDYLGFSSKKEAPAKRLKQLSGKLMT